MVLDVLWLEQIRTSLAVEQPHTTLKVSNKRRVHGRKYDHTTTQPMNKSRHFYRPALQQQTRTKHAAEQGKQHKAKQNTAHGNQPNQNLNGSHNTPPTHPPGKNAYYSYKHMGRSTKYLSIARPPRENLYLLCISSPLYDSRTPKHKTPTTGELHTCVFYARFLLLLLFLSPFLCWCCCFSAARRK